MTADKTTAPLPKLKPTFRNRILTGVVFLVPLVVAFGAAFWIYTKISILSNRIIKNRIDLSALEASHPTLHHWLDVIVGFSAVVVTVLLIMMSLWIIGSLTSNLLMRRVYALFERGILGVPIVRQVYTFSKQVVGIIAQNRDREAQSVVLIEYPKEDCYALAFTTGETTFSDKVGKFITVFVPTTPNPTSGFLLILPAGKARETNLTVEEAARIIMSGGFIIPEEVGAAPYGSLEAKRMPAAELPEPKQKEEDD